MCIFFLWSLCQTQINTCNVNWTKKIYLNIIFQKTTEIQVYSHYVHKGGWHNSELEHMLKPSLLGGGEWIK